MNHQLLRMALVMNSGRRQDETRTGSTGPGNLEPRNLDGYRIEGRNGFSLIELLVVIAIIGVLASLLLPALGNAKEQAKLIKCVSNQKQIGIALQMYRDDNDTKFPPIRNRGVRDEWRVEYGGGDPDRNSPEPGVAQLLPATDRPLWPYSQSPKVFECPADRGLDIYPFWSKAVKSAFATAGTSYQYNAIPWTKTLLPLADAMDGLATKPESWIPEPSRHVLIHCMAALPWQPLVGPPFLHSWHYPSGKVTTSDLKNLSKKTVAPVLFVDGHVKTFNVKQHLQRNPIYYAEPTADRIWYKAKE
jgi:prepilin-type N-terminal cleavage/methylation domain-containing protein/prepilin-type processing-associated H-X9-DG protein